jgi:predicted ATPase
VITQIEIDGFKTFKDFKVELAPFQVIVGANGSGKSNLFDALHLLSRLAEDDLATAFQKLRGRDFEQFTDLGEGKQADTIRLAVEMLVDRKVRDDLGREADLTYTRLRYEVAITLGTDELGLNGLFITHESLASLPSDEDQWRKHYDLANQNGWIPYEPKEQIYFIDDTITSTRQFIPPISPPITQPVILLLSDDGSSEQKIKDIFHSRDLRRTVLSSITTRDFPHAFAAHEELRSLKFLQLNPEILRQPSSINAPRFLGQDGSNLAATLARIQSEDRFAWAAISLDLANVVPDLTHIEVRTDKVQNTYTIWAYYQDGRSFSSRVLSDGTLQLLALATLKNDPQFRGVVCFEEPENGVHPIYLKEIAQTLRNLATDLTDLDQANEPLRQVLVTTHSTAFISQRGITEAILFTYTMTRVEPEASGIPPIRVTHATPVLLSNDPSSNISKKALDRQEVSYTLEKVIELLTEDTSNQALEKLTKSRSTFKEH